MKNLIFLLLAVLLLPSLVLAQPCEPSIVWSRVSSAVSTLHPGILTVMPDGGGDAFAAAGTNDGQTIDATVTVTVRDCNGDPVANFPREDLWLESADGRMVACVGGTTVDSDTDAAGVAVWAAPMRAGGQSTAGLVAMMSGVPIRAQLIPLRIISPDMNGDLAVNLSDASSFVGYYWADYVSYADFNHDHAVNLSDLVIMMGSMGITCD